MKNKSIKKFLNMYLRSFRVLESVEAQAYHLALSEAFEIHPVFHVSDVRLILMNFVCIRIFYYYGPVTLCFHMIVDLDRRIDDDYETMRDRSFSLLNKDRK